VSHESFAWLSWCWEIVEKFYAKQQNKNNVKLNPAKYFRNEVKSKHFSATI
jgi:hypothetical protein